MKVAVTGPGAMGCLFAAYFEAAGHDVVVLDHHEERAGRLSEAGISVSGVCGEVHARPVVTADASRHGPFDFLMLWVKAYSTRTALRQHAAAVGEKTVIFSAQNGIGNIETIAELFPRNPIVGGITTEGAFLEGEGRVRHAGRGKTVVGAANPPAQPHLADVCSMLQAAKLDCEETNDIYTLIWKKLAVNSCINPLTAILGVPNGRLLELPGFSQLARSVVEELVLAASARNITLDVEELVSTVTEVAEKTARNRSSMLQDIECGRRSEIAQINGAVASMVEAPVNSALVRLVEARRRQLAITGARRDEG